MNPTKPPGGAKTAPYTYTVQEQGQPDRVYRGFTSMTDFPKLGQLAAIVWFDGEPDLWLLEDEAALEELRRYYADDWASTGRELPVAVLGTRERLTFDLKDPGAGGRP